MTDRQAFEAWDEAGSYADWRKFDALPKQEQFFECWQAAKATGPQWHDAPTAPGLWVVGSRCLHINELDLPIYGRSNCRWFGPVPADDGGKP